MNTAFTIESSVSGSENVTTIRRIYVRYERQIDKFLDLDMDLIFIKIFIGLELKWLPPDRDLRLEICCSVIGSLEMKYSQQAPAKLRLLMPSQYEVISKVEWNMKGTW